MTTNLITIGQLLVAENITRHASNCVKLFEASSKIEEAQKLIREAIQLIEKEKTA